MLHGWDETSATLTVHQEKLILKVTYKGKKVKRVEKIGNHRNSTFCYNLRRLTKTPLIKAYDKIWKFYEVEIWAQMHFQLKAGLLSSTDGPLPCNGGRWTLPDSAKESSCQSLPVCHPYI